MFKFETNWVSKVEFFNFSGTESVKKVKKFRKQILVIKSTQRWELKLLFRDDLKIKKNELNLEGFFDYCSSLTGRFPKFVVFMIINVAVMKVFYYNPLWNILNEYKRFHRLLKTETTFM